MKGIWSDHSKEKQISLAKGRTQRGEGAFPQRRVAHVDQLVLGELVALVVARLLGVHVAHANTGPLVASVSRNARDPERRQSTLHKR